MSSKQSKQSKQINQATVKILKENIKYAGTITGGVLSALSNGTEFSIAEARKAGVPNPSAVINDLRNNGFVNIYSNPWSRRSERKIARGTVNRYRMA